MSITTSRKVLISVIGVLAVIVVGCSAVVGVTLASGRDVFRTAPAESEPEAWETDQPTEEPATELSAEATETPIASAAIDDPPIKPDASGTAPFVVDYADGKACTPSKSKKLWGGYPAASCRFWKNTEGLKTGESVAKGSHLVAAQRDLGVENPTYADKQSNTWWVWVESDNGTWDWFPATALVEGVTGQPINGIALAD